MSTSTKARSQKLSAAHRSQIVSRLIAMGYRGTELATLVRTGMTRQELADTLIAAQRQAPKKVEEQARVV
jgi:hypothetical protein